jgi:hypothetical protein
MYKRLKHDWQFYWGGILPKSNGEAQWHTLVIDMMLTRNRFVCLSIYSTK